MGHRVVGGAAVGAGGVIGPAYGVAVGLEPLAIAALDLGEGASKRPGQQLFGWVNWRVVTLRTLLGAWYRTIFSIIQPRTKRLAMG